MSKDNRKLFSVAETAAELGVTRARVNQMINTGSIKADKVGRSYVINADELEKARQRNKNPGRPLKILSDRKS
jgi:excisionase family DNA binding protein